MAVLRVLRSLLVMLEIAWFVFALRSHLREHPPSVAQSYVRRWMRPWIAILRMWGPSLWFLPGLLWLGVLHSVSTVILLSVFLPLGMYWFLMVVTGVVPPLDRQPRGALTWQRFVDVCLSLMVSLVICFAVGRGLRDGFREGSQGMFWAFLLSVVVPAGVSLVSFLARAPDQIPFGDQADSGLGTALSMIIGLFTSFPKSAWVVEDGKLERRIAGNPFMGQGTGWLMTEPENVALLRTGFKVTRLVEPGVALMKGAEAPYKIVDLRRQIRTDKVEAVTRDGIHVKVPISSLFRLSPGADPSLKAPWPIRSADEILKAVFAEEVDPSDKTPLQAKEPQPWEDLPLKIATHKLRQAVSFYSLDQLYTDGRQPELMEIHRAVVAALGIPGMTDEDLSSPLTRVTIGRMVRRAVQQALSSYGFEIHGGGVGQRIEPVDPSITRARVDAWKARWTAELMVWQAELEARRSQNVARIQRGVQKQLLAELITKIDASVQSTGQQFTGDVVAYQLLNHLLRMARTPAVSELLPETAVSTLDRLAKTARED